MQDERAPGDPSAMNSVKAWHALSSEEVLRQFDTRIEGLHADEVEQRAARFGPNALPEAVSRSALRRFLGQFHNRLIYVLMLSGLISLLLRHPIDAAVIFAVVLVNAVIGFIQEGRAEQSLEAIRSMIDPRASVIRDGHRTTLPAAEIVPGDVVIIEAGDRVPADLRLLRARSLRIEEAMLTGESVAVEKSIELVPAEAALGDRDGMAFSGTFVTTGQGTGVVVATGVQTELGHISTLLHRVENLETPLIRRMNDFARQLTFVILAISLLVFFFAWRMRGYSPDDAFMTVVGLAVAAIPEGLPAILTITLAIGVRRMASRNAIVRRLPAVETLGSVSVICSDKTGTLTRNEMAARRIVTADSSLEISGVGYEPKGAFRGERGEIDATENEATLQLLRAALLCNDADVRQAQDTDGTVWRAEGDPMEAALVVLAMKAGLDPTDSRRQLPRLDEIPFDSTHRFMATLHHSHNDGVFAFIKGAPERVLKMCARQLQGERDSDLDSEYWNERSHALAAEGHRVLAFASKPFPSSKATLNFEDVEHEAVLLGLVGFIDPPREEAMSSIAQCRAAGIRVVMITGDHAATAAEIGRQLGLGQEVRAMTGQDLDNLPDDRLREVASEISVFARTTPEHKLRLVQALQQDGNIVAMTGDGVNDAPALKRADVGVAMGVKGTEVAKQSAEMVLADDNFASIVAAVREGRTVYDNLLKVIAWTLPTNGGEALTIIAALAVGVALPITAAQILWVNMVTAIALGLTLAFEPTEANTMNRPPRPVHTPILDWSLLWRVAFVSLLFVSGAFGIFYWAEHTGRAIETARTLVVNAFVVFEIFYLFSVRYVHGTSFTWQGVVGTPAVLLGVAGVVVAQIAFTYLPFLQRVFQSRPLSLREGALVIALGVLLLIIVEIEKAVRRSFARRRASA